MIEVGDWIRTKKGNIDKIACEFDQNNWRSKNTYGELIVRCLDDIYLLEDIAKHSKNIIDLIEAGDFVNGYKILEIGNIKNSEQRVFTICKSDFKSICKIWGEQDIQTILTKEQYKAICYTVERKEEWKKNS